MYSRRTGSKLSNRFSHTHTGSSIRSISIFRSGLQTTPASNLRIPPQRSQITAVARCLRDKPVRMFVCVDLELVATVRIVGLAIPSEPAWRGATLLQLHRRPFPHRLQRPQRPRMLPLPLQCPCHP
jgi:hypothetical protein